MKKAPNRSRHRCCDRSPAYLPALHPNQQRAASLPSKSIPYWIGHGRSCCQDPQRWSPGRRICSCPHDPTRNPFLLCSFLLCATRFFLHSSSLPSNPLLSHLCRQSSGKVSSSLSISPSLSIYIYMSTYVLFLFPCIQPLYIRASISFFASLDSFRYFVLDFVLYCSQTHSL